jgi:UDP-N-acetylglucosamine 2-epimerase
MSVLNFVTKNSSFRHLLQEKKDKNKIVFTGSTIIDSLVSFMPNLVLNKKLA